VQRPSQLCLLNDFTANLFQHVALLLYYYMCVEKLQPCWPTFPCCPFSIPFRICHRLNRWFIHQTKPNQTKPNQTKPNQTKPTQQQNMLLFRQIGPQN